MFELNTKLKAARRVAVAIFVSCVVLPAQAITITPGSDSITGGSSGSDTASADYSASNSVLTFSWFDAPVTFLSTFEVMGGLFNVTHDSYFDNGSAATSQVSGFILTNSDGDVFTSGNFCAAGPGIACDLIGSTTVSNILFSNLAPGTYTLGLYDSGSPSVGSASFGIAAVPLPAAAWLFISALAGLSVFGRRRQALATA